MSSPKNSRSLRLRADHLRRLGLGLLLVGLGSFVAAQDALILHLNDFHGQILARGETGGIHALDRAIATEREALGPDRVLLLDAGDWYQGTPEGNVPRGRLVVDVYNALGLTAAVVGNHEYDYGEANLKELIERATFPVLGANIVVAPGGQVRPYVEPFRIVEAGGIRFGVLGLLTPETLQILLQRHRSGLVFDDPVTTCRRWLPELERRGVECVVVLTHLGLEADLRLASQVPGIDLIVGGHSHTPLHTARVEPTHGTTIVQAGSRGAYLGRVEVHRVTDGFRFEPELVPMQKAEPRPGSAIPQILASYHDQIEGEMGERLGRAEREMALPDRSRRGPAPVTTLGYWLGSVMADVTGAPIALHNVGGIRDTLAAGDITRRDLFRISPFGNHIVRVRLKGTIVHDILEASVSGESRSRLEPYGVRVRWERVDDRPRVAEIWVGDERLDEDRDYWVATNNFVAEGGDGWTQFAEYGEIRSSGVELYEATVSAVKALTREGRSLEVEPPTAFQETVSPGAGPVTRLDEACRGPAGHRKFPRSDALSAWAASIAADASASEIGLSRLATDRSLPAGPLERRTLYHQLVPDSVALRRTEIVTFPLAGVELESLLAAEISPGERAPLGLVGATVYWRLEGSDPVVESIEVGGEPVDSRRRYEIAAPRWLAASLVESGSLPREAAFSETGVDLFEQAVERLESGALPALTAESYHQTGSRWFGLVGLAALLSLCVLLSKNRKHIHVRPIIWGVLLQVVIAFIVLKTGWGQAFFEGIKIGFLKINEFAQEGSKMIFGDLAVVEKSGFFILAFTVASTIILVSALTGALYYIGIMQVIVFGFAKVMQKTMRASGAESLAAAANVFIGQTEAPLTVRPYLKSMTSSEIMSMMCGGMATVAGAVLAAYIGFGIDAGHLLAASVMSAPAALVVAKILVPETETAETAGHVPFEIKRTDANLLDAICRGATEGLKLALNVLAMLVAMVALVALINYLLNLGYQAFLASHWEGGPDALTFEYLLGKLFQPFAWLLGVPWSEADDVGSTLGIRMVLNEFVAYESLSRMMETLSPRSTAIATYALCGFANFSSIAIQIGGIGNLEEGIRPRLLRFGVLSMVGGTIATMMTAAVAGVFL